MEIKIEQAIAEPARVPARKSYTSPVVQDHGTIEAVTLGATFTVTSFDGSTYSAV